MSRHHERPTRRENPSGKVVFVARFTDRNGKRSSAGTFPVKGPCRTPAPDRRCCAAHAIEAAYENEYATPAARANTVGSYFADWTKRHPRSARTNTTYNQRLGRVMPIRLQGRPLRDWPIADVKRRHMIELVDVLLRQKGRSASGTQGVLQVLGAMWSDAIGDEVTDANPCREVRVRRNDPRVTKAPREIRVFSWEQMRSFATAAGAVRTGGHMVSERDRWRAVYAEAMVRCLCDCGLRLGEMLALQRDSVRQGWLRAAYTAHKGDVQPGTKTDHGKSNAGRDTPLPAPLEAMLREIPPRLDSRVLFTTPRGEVWRENMFYARIWKPTQEATGLDIRPHEMRHSWISLLLATGEVDPADLARWAGHSVGTMYARYAHSVGETADTARRLIGGA